MANARKQKVGPADALKLARSCKRVIVVKGGKVARFDMSKQVKTTELVAAMLGPTGNLRAPSMRIGSTLLVGFNEPAFREAQS